MADISPCYRDKNSIGTNIMDYQNYSCRKCGSPFHYQVPRGGLFKLFFGFLPIKVFWCPKCVANRYVWVSKSKE